MATWWQILGYESADEADKELASGAISDAEFQRARDEAFQQSSETAADDTPTINAEDIPLDRGLQRALDAIEQPDENNTVVEETTEE